MKRILALAIFLMAIPAMAQLNYTPPPNGAYCLNAGNWIPMLGSSLGVALDYTPPPVGMFAENGTTWYPLACDAYGNLQTSMGNYAAAPATCTPGQTYFNTGSSTPYYCSAINTWTASGAALPEGVN
jgi:hypothetical protein